MKSTKIRERGFTIIELMIVIAIITILAVVLIPKAGIGKSHAKATGILQNERQVKAFVALHKDKGDNVEESLKKEKDFGDMKNPLNKGQKGIGEFSSRQNKCIIICKSKEEVAQLSVGQIGILDGEVCRGEKATTKQEQKVADQVVKEEQKDKEKEKDKEKPKPQPIPKPTPQFEEKRVERYVEQGTSNFNNTLSYKEDGFEGVLQLEGTPQNIGNYTPAQSKTVTDSKTSGSSSFSEIMEYSSGGYSGTLTKSGSASVISGSVTSGHNETYQEKIPEDERFESVSVNLSYHWVGGDNQFLMNGGSVSSFSKYRVTKDGYSGDLEPADTSAISRLLSKKAGYVGDALATVDYYGMITRPARTETRTRWVSGSDTRVWKQNYSGTITKPSSGSHRYKQKYVGTVKRLKK